MIEGFPTGEATCDLLVGSPVVRSHAAKRVAVSQRTLFDWIRDHTPLGPKWPVRLRPDAERLLDAEANGAVQVAYFFPKQGITSAAVIRQDTGKSIVSHHHTIQSGLVSGCTILHQGVESEREGSVWTQEAELRRRTRWHQWFAGRVGRQDSAQREKEMDQSIVELMHELAPRGD